MGEKWLSPVKNLPSLYWSYMMSCIFYSFYAASKSGAGHIPVFAHKDPDCPSPLEQFNVVLRTDIIYGIVYHIIVHNIIIGADPAFGTWPPLSIQILTYMIWGMGEKWLSAVKKPTILVLAIYAELHILLFLWAPLCPERAHTCFCSEVPGLSSPLKQFNVVLRTNMVHMV